MLKRPVFLSILLTCLVAVGACASPEGLSNENCPAEWNESAGPAQLATLLSDDPDRAGLYFVPAHRNESRSSDCVLVVVAGSTAVLGVLNEDRDVQVARVGQADGTQMLALGTPVSVTRDGRIKQR